MQTTARNSGSFRRYEKKTAKFIFKGQAPLDLLSLRIEGERILLYPVEENYSEAMFKEFTKEITKYMFPRPASAIEETLSFVAESQNSMREGSELLLAILKKDTSEFLGCCGLHAKENARRPELGVWIKKDAHGNKYGKEAIVTLVSWAVKHLNFEYITYPVDKGNVPSRKIAEVLGGNIVEERKVETMSGRMLDEVVYHISYDTLSITKP